MCTSYCTTYWFVFYVVFFPCSAAICLRRVSAVCAKRSRLYVSTFRFPSGILRFIRYEMITGRKDTLKKKIAGKETESQQIDEKNDRQFYIQNGYEYYPFQGEYWLDEVGNYHFLGKQSCE